MNKFLFGLGAAVVVFVHIRIADRLNDVEFVVEDMIKFFTEEAENEYQEAIDTMFEVLSEGLDPETE